MGEAADAEVRIPRFALDAVQRALVSVHAAVGLHATLQAIAEGATSSTPYTQVSGTSSVTRRRISRHDGCHDDMRNDKMAVKRHDDWHGTRMVHAPLPRFL
jgi:hypothetical protein